MVSWTAPVALVMENQIDGNPINFDTAGTNIDIILLASTYTFSSAHEFVSDLVIATHEVSGTEYTGFTAGGASEDLAGQVVGLDAPIAGQVNFDATDHAFAQNAGGFTTARHLWLVFNNTTDANSQLILHSDLGADKGNVDGSLTFQWHADGIIKWSSA